MSRFIPILIRLLISLSLVAVLGSAVASGTTDVVPETGVEDEAPAYETPRELVVLLHGLGRSRRSLRLMARGLEKEGYRVLNVGYPSRSAEIEELSALLSARLREARVDQAPRLHFVTHSMGGILLRLHLAAARPENLGRVVMLCPPNQGSELSDVFGRLLGPAGSRLGRDADDLPAQLSPVDFELGVIAGDKTWNPLYSLLVSGEDDGKVAIESTQVEGMRDFILLHHTHTFIMNAGDTRRQVIHFLRHGYFERR